MATPYIPDWLCNLCTPLHIQAEVRRIWPNQSYTGIPAKTGHFPPSQTDRIPLVDEFESPLAHIAIAAKNGLSPGTSAQKCTRRLSVAASRVAA